MQATETKIHSFDHATAIQRFPFQTITACGKNVARISTSLKADAVTCGACRRVVVATALKA